MPGILIVALLSSFVGGALSSGYATLGDATLRSDEHRFELQYPDSYEVMRKHVEDPSYEETFYLRRESSTLLSLRVDDLTVYLPRTSTPTEARYLRSQRTLPGFRSIRVDGKGAYEYRTCGRGACQLSVMFIHRHRMYTFTVQIAPERDPTRAGFRTLPAEQQQVIRSLRFLDE